MLNPRSPLQQIDEPGPAVTGLSVAHADGDEQPRKRKVPASHQSPPAQDSTATSSRYFASSASGAKAEATELARELRLSPHRQPALFLPESDDENKPVAGPSRQAPKAREIQHTDWKMGMGGGDDSSEYEFGLDVDESEMLAALDRVEKEQGQRGSSMTAAPSSAAGASSSSRPVTSRRLAQEHSIIEIDDDEDEKENMPAPTRRVRQRTATQRSSQMIPDDDVIELSD